jgi:AAHS family 4-hydroxybenzoate transporter-like MFS transporter
MAIDLGSLIDESQWTPYQRALVGMTALAVVFDGFDNQLLGVALPSIMADWRSPRATFAPVVSVGYLGMMLGGAVAGIAGDRLGRRVAIVLSMLLFGATTAAVALAGSVTTLAVLRFVAGVGLGGAIPNAAALAAEYVPLERRPLAVTLTIVCVPLGGVLAGLVAVPALPALGWRGLFALGGIVPCLAALAFVWMLPESPRFLARHPHRWPELVRLLQRMGHQVDADASFADRTEQYADAAHSRATLLARGLAGDTVALWAAFFSCLLAVYLGFSWLPSILASGGLSSTVASTSLTVFNLGGVAGAIAAGALIPRLGSRRPLVTMAAGAAAGASVLSVTPIAPQSSVLWILVLLTVTGGLINAVQTTMYALAASIYPARVRATGVGTATAIGRTGAIVSGYAGPQALDAGGSSAFFVTMAAALSVTFVALALIRRHIPPR